MAIEKIDRETGEFADENYQERLTFNFHYVSNETGEPEVYPDVHEFTGRVPFKIPGKITGEFLPAEERKMTDRWLKDLLPICEGTSFAEMNPVFLFLPAIFYFKWFAISLMIFEVTFHVWSHRKNKSLKDVYYRSPFHGITSEYCAHCQFETCMTRVGKMQQVRMHKFLHHCKYIKRAVT